MLEVEGISSSTRMQDIVLAEFNRSSKRELEDKFLLARPVLAAVLTGIGYYVGAKIGFALTFQPHPVSTLWPPNSILLAALVLSPYRRWWLLLLAVLPVHFLIELQSGIPTVMSLCWFISNSSEAVIGAFCLRYLNGGPVRFDSIRQVAIFVFAAVFAPFLSSFLDAGFVVMNRWGSGSYWQIWRMRFTSNVLAELIIVPLIVMWGTDRIAPFRSLLRWLESGVLAIGLLVVSLGSLSWFQAGWNTPALLYMPLPILLWAAVRFGPKGLNLCLAVVTLLAIWSAVHGRGPFVANSPEQNALSIQLFLTLISMPLMFLAAVIQQLGRAQEATRQNEDRLIMALNSAQMGTWDWHIRSGASKWSEQTKRMFGLRPTDSELQPDAFYSLIHPDDRASVEDAIDRSITNGTPYEAEFRMRQPDGTNRWIRGQGKVVYDDDKPVRIIGVNADITRRKDAERELLESHRQIRALAGQLINAQEAERRQVSHELHDDLNQRVAMLSVAISQLKRTLPVPEDEIIRRLNDLYDQTNDLSNDIRQLSHQLHPATLEHLGLADALSAYTDDFERETGISTSFAARLRSEKIAFEVSVCLYRIALEALRNIARHSQAKSCSVLLEEQEQVLTLKVVDSGIGFDVETARRGSGLGLISAAERVHLLEGSFEVVSTPLRGTQLIASIPMR